MSYRSLVNYFSLRLRSDSFWPITYFSWIYCHWGGSSVVCGTIFSTLVLLSHICGAIYVQRYVVSNIGEHAETEVYVFVWYCRMIANTLAVPVLVILWMIRGHRLVRRVVSTVANVDKILSKFGECPSKNSDLVKWLLVIFFPLLLISVINWLQMQVTTLPIFGITRIVFSSFSRNHELVLLFTQLLFSSLSLVIEKRYRAVNLVLKKLSENYNHEFGNHSQQLISDWINAIRELRSVHRKLFSAVENVSDAFGFQLLIVVIFSSIIVIGEMYNLYLEYASSCGTAPKPVIEYFIWCFVHIGPLCFAAFCCSQTSAQEKYTAVLLQEMSIADDNLRMEISTFSLQLIHYDLHFSACGFFDVDLTLIQVIIATIVTYLVILIQIGIVPTQCRHTVISAVEIIANSSMGYTSEIH